MSRSHEKGDLKNEPDASAIAVVGMACRFPDANNYQEFWRNLRSGKTSVREIPGERWGALQNEVDAGNSLPGASWAGLLDQIDQFDAEFFGLSAAEAEVMDPQHRILLELSWACLEDAGYIPSRLYGSKIGVFLGISTDDYKELVQYHRPDAKYAQVGNAHAVAANRISSFFSFRGTSMAIDTAGSSSLVSLHHAIREIHDGSCSMALVGGVNVICNLHEHFNQAKRGRLAAGGKCWSFDEKADGYLRGEGAGLILLKPLSQAVADNDSIHAVIKGSAVNHGGWGATFEGPDVEAQSEVIVEACRKAKVAPESITFVEAHGIGRPENDAIEWSCLERAFKELSGDNLEKHYCGIGSLKSNIGHLEAASGIASIFKVILAMKYGELPPQPHFTALNPKINTDSPFYIVDSLTDWKAGNDNVPLRAGINTFGYSGTNAYIVLEQYAEVGVANEVSANKGEEEILVFSAKSVEQLKYFVEHVRKYLDEVEAEGEVSLSDLAFTLQTGRESFAYRMAIVVKSFQEAREKLDDFLVKKAKIDGLSVGTVVLKEYEGSDVDLSEDREYVEKIIAKKNLGKLARLWTQGFGVNWNHLYPGQVMRRARVMTYPFAPTRYWVKSNRRIESRARGVDTEKPDNYSDSDASVTASETLSVSTPAREDSSLMKTAALAAPLGYEEKGNKPELGKPQEARVGEGSYSDGTSVPVSVEEPDSDGMEQELIILSAHGEQQLSDFVSQLLHFLQTPGLTLRLQDVAFTLQTARRPLEYRVAWIASSMENFLEILKRYCDGRLVQDTFIGTADMESSKLIPFDTVQGEGSYLDGLMEERNYVKLASIWVKGGEINWDTLHKNRNSKQIDLLADSALIAKDEDTRSQKKRKKGKKGKKKEGKEKQKKESESELEESIEETDEEEFEASEQPEDTNVSAGENVTVEVHRIDQQFESILIQPEEQPKVEFIACGEGPCLLMIGSLLADYRCFKKQIDVFSKHYKLIIFHQPGCGQSGFDKYAIAIKQMAKSVSLIFDALEIKEPIPVFGYSFGGFVAQQFCFDYPDLVSSLVLAHSTSDTESVVGKFNAITESFLCDPRFQSLFYGINPNWIRLYDKTNSKVNFTPELDSLQVPILVIAGTEDEFVKVNLVRLLTTIIPNGKLIELEGAGHFAPLTHPNEFNRAVMSFLGQTEITQVKEDDLPEDVKLSTDASQAIPGSASPPVEVNPMVEKIIAAQSEGGQSEAKAVPDEPLKVPSETVEKSVPVPEKVEEPALEAPVVAKTEPVASVEETAEDKVEIEYPPGLMSNVSQTFTEEPAQREPVIRVPSIFDAASRIVIEELKSYIRDGRVGNSGLITPEAAQLGYLFNELLNFERRSNKRENFKVLFANGLLEAIGNAIRIARHYEQVNETEPSGKILMVDRDGLLAQHFDPLNRSNEHALVPGIEFVRTLDELVAKVNKNSGYAAVYMESTLDGGNVTRFNAVMALMRYSNILTIFRECNEQLSEHTLLTYRLGLFPDIVVFGEEIAERQIPISAYCIRDTIHDPWKNSISERYAHSAQNQYGFGLRFMRNMILDKFNFLKGQNRIVNYLEELDRNHEATCVAYYGFVNPGYLEAMKPFGFDARFSSGRKSKVELTFLTGGQRSAIDLVGNYGFAPRGLNSYDIIKDVLDEHNPEYDYERDLAKYLCGKTEQFKYFPSVSNSSAIDLGLTFLTMAHPKRTRMVFLKGRTGATLISSAGANPFYRDPFEPLYQDCLLVDPFDTSKESLQILTDELMSGNIAGVWLDRILFETGNRVVRKSFFEIIAWCKEAGGYFIGMDETQTALLPGQLLKEAMGIKPDIVAFSSALGDAILPTSGVVVGEEIYSAVCACNKDIVDVHEGRCRHRLGAHIALNGLRKLYESGATDEIDKKGRLFKKELERIEPKHDVIKGVFGDGLLLGVVLDVEMFPRPLKPHCGKLLAGACLRDLKKSIHFSVAPLSPHIIRFSPAYTITDREIREAVLTLDRIFEKGIKTIIKETADYARDVGNKKEADFFLVALELQELASVSIEVEDEVKGDTGSNEGE